MFPQFRTVVEADGLAKYDAATVSERRRLLRQSFVRDQRLADRDVEIIHFGWEDAVLTPTMFERMQTARAPYRRSTLADNGSERLKALAATRRKPPTISSTNTSSPILIRAIHHVFSAEHKHKGGGRRAVVHGPPTVLGRKVAIPGAGE
jgi:hypothetical protein